MNIFNGILSTFLASSLAFVTIAANGMTLVNPSDCNVDASTDSVEILVSEVPGHSFITCNGKVVIVNPSHTVFINEMNVAPRPTSPWVTNTDGGESFVCRDSLDNCKVLYQQSG